VLGVSGAANLFFLNPNGIVFGPDASLDVNGSFFASTANSLVFRDGSRFSATRPEAPPLLTVGVPVGVQFGNSPGDIQATGAFLAVPKQATLALLGGAIALDGAQLEAPGGRVALGGVNETGTIALSSRQSGPIWRLSGWEFPENLGRSPISLTNNAHITVVDQIGGEMAIDGSDISISNSFIEAGIAEGLGVANADSGNIELNATGQLTLSNSSIINRVTDNSVGNAGDIRLVANVVEMSDGAQLDASTFGQGDAGTVRIEATDRAVFSDSAVFTDVEETGRGNSGNVRVTANIVEVRDGAQLITSTSGQGDAGTVTVEATDRAVFSDSAVFTDVEETGRGNSGNVRVTANIVEVRDGGQFLSSTRGQGNAGTVTVEARDRVLFSGLNAEGFPSAVFTDVEETGRGNSGNVRVTANIVEVRDGARIFTSTSGQGDAGMVRIEATDRAVFSDSIVFTDVEETGRGNAGSVQVVANRLEMRDGAVLSSTNASLVTPNDFTAGDVLVQAKLVQLDEGAGIFANTRGQGGNVRLDGASLTILRRGSGIQTNAEGDFPGGNIILNTTLLVASENSDITANATNSSGGRVQITTQGIFGTEFRNELTPKSDITATSELGREFRGVVAIISPDVNPTSGLTDLPQSPVDVSRLLGTGCSPQNMSSFTVTGRGGLPPSPTDLLDRTRVLPDLGPELDISDPEGASDSGASVDRPLIPLAEATGWVRQSDGAVVLVMAEGTRSDVWQPLRDCGDNE
jgi:large exoprotein involved in heme utilization and adhesion